MGAHASEDSIDVSDKFILELVSEIQLTCDPGHSS